MAEYGKGNTFLYIFVTVKFLYNLLLLYRSGIKNVSSVSKKHCEL